MPTLVLNAGYEPLAVVALRRAIAGAAAFRVRLLAKFAPPSLGARLGIGRRPSDD